MTACLQFARRFVLSIACLPLACVGDASAQVRDGSFQFGLVGDTGYTAAGVDEFKRLLAAINRTELAFFIHVGDFQNDPRGYNPNPAVGAMPCVDERYKDVYDSFQSVRHPFKARSATLWGLRNVSSGRRGGMMITTDPQRAK